MSSASKVEPVIGSGPVAGIKAFLRKRRNPAHAALMKWVWAKHPYYTGLCAGLSMVQASSAVAFVVVSGFAVGAIPPALDPTAAAIARSTLLHLMIIVAFTYAIQYSVWPVLGFLGDDLGRRVDGDIRGRLIVALSGPHGISHLEDPDTTSDLPIVRGMGDGLYTPGRAIGAYFRTLSTWITVLGNSLVVALIYSPWLAVALTTVLVFLRTRMVRDLFANTRQPVAETEEMARATYHRNLLIGYEAAREIRIYQLTSWLVDRFRRHWLAGMDSIWEQRRRVVSRPWTWSIPWGGASALALFAVAYGATHEQLTLAGAVITFQACLGALNVWINVDDVQLAHGAAAIPTLTQLERRIALAPEPLGRLPPAHGTLTGITFEDVWFSYPRDNRFVLKGLNLHVPAGKSLAIVGANGAGKTTAVKLISRLYEPGKGRIVADGHDIRDFDVDLWQRGIAPVFQDYAKFELSVQENVGAGWLEARGSCEALEHAARAAGALEFIEALPQGWNTLLSAQGGGADLSGGQWQRIAIARAMLALQSGARVLILDEPTASLDARSEAELFRNVLGVASNITTILVSHRLSTVRYADQICVIEDGTVVELGSHSELVALAGRYAEMFKVQAERFDASDDDARPEEVRHG